MATKKAPKKTSPRTRRPPKARPSTEPDPCIRIDPVEARKALEEAFPVGCLVAPHQHIADKLLPPGAIPRPVRSDVGIATVSGHARLSVQRGGSTFEGDFVVLEENGRKGAVLWHTVGRVDLTGVPRAQRDLRVQMAATPASPEKPAFAVGDVVQGHSGRLYRVTGIRPDGYLQVTHLQDAESTIVSYDLCTRVGPTRQT